MVALASCNHDTDHTKYYKQEIQVNSCIYRHTTTTITGRRKGTELYQIKWLRCNKLNGTGLNDKII